MSATRYWSFLQFLYGHTMKLSCFVGVYYSLFNMDYTDQVFPRLDTNNYYHM